MSTQTRPSESAKTGFQLPKWAGSFGFQIIAALVVGLGLGLLAKYTGSTKANPNALGTTLQTIGSSYVSLLQTAVVPTIVAKREGILDVERYRSTSTVDPLARVEENDGVDADLRVPATV